MTILVTGANRGIGAEMVRQYVNSGNRVIATTRGNIPADLETAAEWYSLDVTDQASVTALAAKLDGREIGLLICNAGAYLDKGHQLTDGFTPDVWAQSFAINATGPFLTIRALLPNLQKATGARIAVVASKMGSNEMAAGGAYAYRASKAAAINLVSNLAKDISGLGISVGAYHPGWVQTDMGGRNADIDVETSARGLIERFESLSPTRSGCFENYDGTPLPH